jgi:hypothetical protein
VAGSNPRAAQKLEVVCISKPWLLSGTMLAPTCPPEDAKDGDGDLVEE